MSKLIFVCLLFSYATCAPTLDCKALSKELNHMSIIFKPIDMPRYVGFGLTPIGNVCGNASCEHLSHLLKKYHTVYELISPVEPSIRVGYVWSLNFFGKYQCDETYQSDV